MALPLDFHQHISDGLRILRGEESHMRKLACNGDPRVVDELRDVQSLRERVELYTRTEWEMGQAPVDATAQDLEMLLALEARHGTESPNGAALRRFREALDQYGDYRWKLHRH